MLTRPESVEHDEEGSRNKIPFSGLCKRRRRRKLTSQTVTLGRHTAFGHLGFLVLRLGAQNGMRGGLLWGSKRDERRGLARISSPDSITRAGRRVSSYTPLATSNIHSGCRDEPCIQVKVLNTVHERMGVPEDTAPKCIELYVMAVHGYLAIEAVERVNTTLILGSWPTMNTRRPVPVQHEAVRARTRHRKKGSHQMHHRNIRRKRVHMIDQLLCL